MFFYKHNNFNSFQRIYSSHFRRISTNNNKIKLPSIIWFTLRSVFKNRDLLVGEEYPCTYEIRITSKNIRKFMNTIRKTYKEGFNLYLRDFAHQKNIISNISTYLLYKCHNLKPKGLDEGFIDNMDMWVIFISYKFIELYPEETRVIMYTGDLGDNLMLTDALYVFRLVSLSALLEQCIDLFKKEDERTGLPIKCIRIRKSLMLSPEIFDEEDTKIRAKLSGFYSTISQIEEVVKDVLSTIPIHYLMKVIQNKKDYNEHFRQLVKDILMSRND